MRRLISIREGSGREEAGRSCYLQNFEQNGSGVKPLHFGLLLRTLSLFGGEMPLLNTMCCGCCGSCPVLQNTGDVGVRDESVNFARTIGFGQSPLQSRPSFALFRTISQGYDDHARRMWSIWFRGAQNVPCEQWIQ